MSELTLPLIFMNPLGRKKGISPDFKFMKGILKNKVLHSLKRKKSELLEF